MADATTLSDLLTELPVVIQPVDDLETRFRGNLLGRVSEDRLLISTLPDMSLAIDDRIIVRALQSGKALGFETRIKDLVHEPVPLLFVELPAGLEILKLRKSDRLNLLVPVDIRYTKGKGDQTDTVILRGNLLNISGGGCRVFTKNQIAPESTVNLSFHLPGEKLLHNLSGTVIESSHYQSQFDQRVRFHPSTKNTVGLAEVKSWVEQHQEFIDLTD